MLARKSEASEKKRLELEERRRELAEQVRLKESLPHIYGWNWYDWAWDYFHSVDKVQLLCAGNQISKSSSQIRKCIDWATNTKKWPLLWATRPQQFWYLYPTLEVATVEVENKWMTEFLPQGDMIKDPVYGYKINYGQGNKVVKSIDFNSGVTVYFKSYMTNVQALQTSSAHAVFCDEELPEELYPEIKMRVAATNGYFSMVFTATIGQEMWRRAVEEIGTELETHKKAFKRQVSMYDCLIYKDGTKSHWTVERIQEIEQSLPSQAEIDRRVHGKFVRSEGLAYPSFSPRLHPHGNVYKDHPLPESWETYVGIDPGGGGSGHPAAITFLAVNKDYTEARVSFCWRGDKKVTTAADILEKYLEMKGTRPVREVRYDYAAKDFHTIANDSGVDVIPAIKDRKAGKDTLGTLFKNKALAIPDTEEGMKLVSELLSLPDDVEKSHAKDDLIDSLRYAVMAVPWNWEKIVSVERFFARASATKTDQEIAAEWAMKKRRGEVEEVFDAETGRIIIGEDLEAEFDDFNRGIEV